MFNITLKEQKINNKRTKNQQWVTSINTQETVFLKKKCSLDKNQHLHSKILELRNGDEGHP